MATLALLACTLARADRLCVTRGAIEPLTDGGGRITQPKVRAVLPGSDGDQAELRFRYEGPSDDTARLGSGELRRQIGLKLRAQDGCNLVYVMWRIEPKPQLVVSVKSNPGMRTHAECKNGGYRNLRGKRTQPVVPLEPGSSHALGARIEGNTLRVWADRALVWEGELPPEAARLSGPAGLRADNGRFTVAFSSGHAVEGRVRCVESDEE